MARMRTFLIVAATALLLLTSFSIAVAETPPLTLLKRWNASIDPTGWWMSEKYDGIRGYWDGARMWTRQGRPVAIPDALRRQLPPFALDGELWAGRGRFAQTASIVRDASPGPGWSKIHYMVFEAPGGSGPFEARLTTVQSWLTAHPSNAIPPVQHRRCAGKAPSPAFLHKGGRRGGEGAAPHSAAGPPLGRRPPAHPRGP